MLKTASAILIRMQCVGLLHRFHKNVKKEPGIGVVMSGAVYRRWTGKTFVFGGTVNRLGLKGKMPRPLLVVHSGKTTITRSLYFERRVSRSMRRALG